MHTNINKEVVHPWVHELYGENSFQVAPYVQIVTVKPIAYGKLSTALNWNPISALLFSKKLYDQLIKWDYILVRFYCILII